MKPGRRIFASNAVWVGGPDAGTPTKIPAAAGDLADGRYRAMRPAPQLDNLELWTVTTRLDLLSAGKLLNLINEPVTAAGWPVAWTGGAMDGIHDPTAATRDVHSVVDGTGALAFEERVSRGGRLWTAGVGGILACTAPRIAVDGAGVRAMVTGTAVGANVEPYSSTAYAAWASWVGASPAGTWADIDYGGIAANARWVMGDGAHAGGVGAIRRSPGIATLFSSPFADPTFAGPVTCLAYSHHYPGDVYPDDPGNQIWVALTATEAAAAVDATANTWSLAAAHGLGATPVDLGCSKLSGEFLAIDLSCGISRSTDGVTWTRSGAGTATGLWAVIVNATTARIATDGFGHWVALLVDSVAGSAEVHVSWDDGATWHEAWPDVVLAGIAAGCVWYGLGQFHVVLTDAAAAGLIFSSQRSGE